MLSHNMKITIAMILVCLIALVAFVPNAQASTFTFQPISGDWDNQDHWLDPTGAKGIPGEFDNARIPAGKTCTLDASAAAMKLTILDGGTVVINSILSLDLGENLTSGSALVIEDGGLLQISGTVAGRAYLNLYGDITLDGDFPAPIICGLSTQIVLFADVTLNGTGTLVGRCHDGTNMSGSFDFTVGSGVTVKNLGRTQVDKFINNGTVIVDCGNGFEVFEILGNEAYGSGTWHIKMGHLKSDDDVIPVWSTPGEPGEFIIEGTEAFWTFGGSCDDSFSDTLTFIKGTFEFRDYLNLEYSFRNCGNFTFGDEDGGTMVIDVDPDRSFEVGGTCE